MVDLKEFKRFFLFNLIGSLIICALVAVVTVLLGDFNEVTGKVLFTLAMVVIHSLVCLAFIWDEEKTDTLQELNFFKNVVFFLIVLSFITSIFGVWNIVEGDIIGKLYLTYFLIGFASLHGDKLSKALSKENYLDLVVYLNYLFILIVVLMLLPIIYSIGSLGEIYYRFLGAAAIIDGTCSVLTIIFYRLYFNSHPKVENPYGVGVSSENLSQEVQEKKSGLSIWMILVIVYLVIQVLSIFIYSIF